MRSFRVSLAGLITTLLTATCLGGLFETWLWFPHVALVAAGTVGAAMVARLWRSPRLIEPLAAGAGFLLFLAISSDRGSAWLGIVPTPSSFTNLMDELAAGAEDTTTLSLPVPATPGLIALTAGGMGIVALLVDVCAVTLRRPALAGLALLGTYVVAVGISPTSISWLAFAAGGLGFLALLGVEYAERIGGWGRLVGGRARATRNRAIAVTPLGKTGRIVALGCVAVAVGITAVLPGEPGAGWLTGVDSWSLFGPHGRAVEAIHPMTQLRGYLTQDDPVELMQVRTNDDDPFYLRVATLDVFNSQGWTQSELRANTENRVGRGIPRSEFLDRDAPVVKQNTKIDIRAFTDSRFLPVYANPREVAVRGDWRWDRQAETIFSTRSRTADLRYTVESTRVRYTPELLASVGWPENIRQSPPADAPSDIRDLVNSLIAGADTQYDAVLAIQEHFSPENGFRYSERTKPGTSGSALSDFLENKQGYCEQYASAMAYLLKVAGVPTRVAVGFGYGEHRSNGDDSYISILNQDAHAWVEVLFPGLGWVPFDPTPPTGTGRTGDLSWAKRAVDDRGQQQPGVDPNAPAPAPNEQLAEDRVPNDQLAAEGTPVVYVDFSARRIAGFVLLGLAALLALATVPTWIRLARRRQRLRRLAAPSTNPVVAANLAWAELIETATDLGLPQRPAETVRNYAARLRRTGLDKNEASAVTAISTATEHARYARVASRAQSDPALLRSVRLAIGALTAGVNYRQFIRATLWPASVVARNV